MLPCIPAARSLACQVLVVTQQQRDGGAPEARREGCMGCQAPGQQRGRPDVDCAIRQLFAQEYPLRDRDVPSVNHLCAASNACSTGTPAGAMQDMRLAAAGHLAAQAAHPPPRGHFTEDPWVICKGVNLRDTARPQRSIGDLCRAQVSLFCALQLPAQLLCCLDWAALGASHCMGSSPHCLPSPATGSAPACGYY